MRVASGASARIYGMPGKGRIAVGNDADLVIVDPDLEDRRSGRTRIAR